MSSSFHLLNPTIKSSVKPDYLVMKADIEYKRDDIFKPENGEVVVRFHQSFINPNDDRDKEKARSLLCYYAKEKLKMALANFDFKPR